MRVAAFRVGRLKGKAVLLITVLCLLLFFSYRGVCNMREQITAVELTTQAHPGRVTVHDKKILRDIAGQIAEAEIKKDKVVVKGNYKLILITKKGIQTYLFDHPAHLVEPQTEHQLILQDGGMCLDSLIRQLAVKNPYGEYLPWVEVNKIFRKFDKARVVDFETGESFVIQRRAGSKHADVQPVSAQESAIMKKIYGDRWSWKRRAVIVQVNGRRIAASMNGMPHGAGALEGNDFDGHFCIHFRDSKTHSNQDNLAHQIMVWKAAGKVEEMLTGAGAEHIIRVMLTFMEQGDFDQAGRLIRPSAGISAKEVNRQLNNIKWLAVSEITKPKGEKVCEFEVKVSYELKDGTQIKNRQVSFAVVKDEGKIPWKISSLSIVQLLAKQKEDGKEAAQGKSVYYEWKMDLGM